MERDAVSAGVSEVGGLFSSAEIKILICYIISSINEPVPGSLLANELHFNGIANCFEVNDAIALLCKNGQLQLHNEKEDTYTITASGRTIAETLKSSLPIAVKDRAYSIALKMFKRFKSAKETDIKISREGDKTFITCSAIDGGNPFMSVKLLVTDQEQAIFIKNRFLEDPSSIYSEIINLLTSPKN